MLLRRFYKLKKKEKIRERDFLQIEWFKIREKKSVSKKSSKKSKKRKNVETEYVYSTSKNVPVLIPIKTKELISFVVTDGPSEIFKKEFV